MPQRNILRDDNAPRITNNLNSSYLCGATQDGDMDMDVLVGDKGTRERYGLMLLNDGGASLTPVLDSGLNGNYGNLPEDSALGICAADLDGEDPRTDTLAAHCITM
jgi:hypothetical protein